MGIKIMKETASVVVLTALSKFLTVYAFNVGLARVLSPEDFGDYKVAETFVGLASVPILMGGASAALKFLPNAVKECNLALIWEYTRFYIVTALILSILLSLMTFIISIYFFSGDNHHHPMVYATALVPVMAITILIGSIFQANNYIYMSIFPRWIFYPILKLLFVLGLFFILGKVTDIGAIITAFLALTIVLIYLLIKVRSYGILKYEKATDHTPPIVWLTTSIPMMLILLLQRSFSQVDIYMIEIYSTENAVGHYAAAQITASILLVIQSSIMLIYNPLMTPAIKEGLDKMRELNVHCFRNLFIFTLPVSVILFVFPETVLSVFGHEEPDATMTLQLLIPGYIFCILYAIPYSCLQFAGQEKKVTLVMVMSLSMSIVLDVLLIPDYGIQGAALGTSVMFFITFILLTMMMKKYLGIFPWSGMWEGFKNIEKSKM